MKHGLGRRLAKDARDLNYPVVVRLTAPALPERAHRYWFANGWWGDQGATPMCVAYSWMHWLEDGPVTQRGKGPIFQPSALYYEAQVADEWPGEDYDGTSVRAGAKALKARGLVAAYHWATTVHEIAASVLELGPMVLGTNWYDDMFSPDDAGFLHVGGALAGGHAYLIDGVNVGAASFRIKNSWGRSWGNNGFAQISFEDLSRLLAEDGEACIAEEIRK